MTEKLGMEQAEHPLGQAVMSRERPIRKESKRLCRTDAPSHFPLELSTTVVLPEQTPSPLTVVQTPFSFACPLPHVTQSVLNPPLQVLHNGEHVAHPPEGEA